MRTGFRPVRLTCPHAEAYPFLWLREFDRLARPGGTGWFYRRMLSGQGGAQPGRVAEYGMSWSRKSRTTSLLSTVESAGFWNLPTLAQSHGNAVNAVQACRAHWIVEGIKSGRYHVVDRCSPEPARTRHSALPHRKAMLAMKLGNLGVHKSNLY